MFTPQLDEQGRGSNRLGAYRQPMSAAFLIVRELTGPEIPCDMRGMGDYFVLEVVRKFRVTAHAHETTFSTEEIK
jgi:hypothetical protein